jgi:hypothetical protein
MIKFISQSVVFGFILSQSRVGTQKVLFPLFLNINKILRLRLSMIKFISHGLSSLDLLLVSQEWVLKKSFLYFSTSIKYYDSGFP